MGLNARSGEVIVGTNNGIEMARTIRRKVESEAFDRHKILGITVTPWDRAALRHTMPHLSAATANVPREYQREPPGVDV